MEVKWIKIATNIFDDEKLLLIESMPESDAIIVIWFKLLCMAGKQNNNGVFMLNDKIAYTEEMLATIFRKQINTVRLALKTFENLGMIEIIDNVITIPNWEKHQNIDGLEKIREQNRKRVANHRAKQKKLIGETKCNVTGNATLHYGNAIEEEKEIDKEKKDKKDKKDKRAVAPTKYFKLPNAFTNELIKIEYIEEHDLFIDQYNALFDDLVEEYSFELVRSCLWYFIKRIRQGEENIENKFAYFKATMLNNVNKVDRLNNEDIEEMFLSSLKLFKKDVE